MAANNEQPTGKRKIFAGEIPLHFSENEIAGDFTELDGERFYQIRNFDHLAPFFMSVVSDSNHWMFVSSNGALTCGRRNPDGALFPYTTDDKIHDAQGQVGPQTVLLVERQSGDALWEPFSKRYEGVYEVERNLYKNTPGNKLVFEEINRTLQVEFRYAWFFSDEFGFVRQSTVTNLANRSIRLRLIDGIKNLLPANVDRTMQNNFSTLVDGYKKSELISVSGIGIFALSSIPVDRAEPSESLLANTVWSIGLERPIHLLSDRQLESFRRGYNPDPEYFARGVRGAYFVHSEIELKAGQHRQWLLIAEVDQNACAIAELDQRIQQDDDLVRQILTDVEQGTSNLQKIVAEADGIQSGGDPLQAARHFSNTLFNVMRGGIFDDGYNLSRSDLAVHLESSNQTAFHQIDMGALPERFSLAEGLAFFQGLGDPDLERLYCEYLPLTFSRRHGDPSRPWNAFSIETRNPDGSRKLSYQGNWRDIFQNWEALGISYPEYLEGMIFKFVNASTADGYNPYRITRDGIDWEVHDPEDPWSNIGYWGDHQIVYLLKLMEHSEAYHPGRLQAYLGKEIFAYASVPYRIKPYAALLADAQNTIEFDHEAHHASLTLADQIGSDGKLLFGPNEAILHVNLTEKLLVPLLAKLSNFIPDAGIWMNTQRPEWNDANNALVGSGVSMVTLYYFRRYLRFCSQLFADVSEQGMDLSEEVAEQLREMLTALQDQREQLFRGFDSRQRRELLDLLGRAGSRFRAVLYAFGLTGNKTSFSVSDIVAFLNLVQEYVDRTIESNRREDGLYHAYNLMQVDSDGGISIRHLDEMLEGQVAVLSSGRLDAAESLELLQALRASSLYREDQNSYLLYPDRELASFMEKNCVPAKTLELTNVDPRVLSQDCHGQSHFNPALRNATDLERLLKELDYPPAEREELLDLYESVFDHQSFTGRSGTFFKYEGLGCIYWHMVSKLLLAAAEACRNAKASQESDALIRQLVDRYHDIRGGIGAHKSVVEQGGFPTDPYSHTPSMLGAQQPGLTGQVKEDFMVRLIELGIRVEKGCIRFDPFLLSDDEFSNGVLEFTFCNVPIDLSKGEVAGILAVLATGETIEVGGLTLDRELSQQIFQRNGAVERLRVTIR